MTAPRPHGSLLAAALGVAAVAASPSAGAQAPAAAPRDQAPRAEVVVTATRLTDEALTAKVVEVLRDDPYIFADHMSVVTENGVVRLQGIVLDIGDLHRALMLARRIAGRRRVVSELELILSDVDN
jgi:osmotically-inducible protein OsmY